MEPELVDRIYECGFVPENWPAVLRDISRISDSAGASLFVTDPSIRAWTASARAREFTERFVGEGWYWRGRLMKRVHETPHCGWVRDADLLAQADLDDEPIYRGIWGSVGVGHGVATTFALPHDESLAIVMPRLIAKGPATSTEIDRLDQLRPHLGRAALIGARLRLERARAAGDALAALGLAALVLNADGKVLAANAQIEAAGAAVYWRSGDRVTLKDRKADRILAEAILRMRLPGDEGVRSFPVRDEATGAVSVGHVIPVRLSARDIFASDVAIFVLAPVGAPKAPPAELMRSLFDLTPSEARVAHGLARGKTVDELAGEASVSSNTVRVQVRGVLEKTGYSRQADVVAMMATVGAILRGR